MKTKHSTDFLHEMKAKLVSEQALLKKELAELADQTPDGKYVPKFPDYGRDEEDNATEVADYATTVGTVKANQERLQTIEEALKRIEDGTYGLTADGQEIPEDRLRANPAATTLAQ